MKEQTPTLPRNRNVLPLPYLGHYDEEALHRRKCQRNSATNRHLKELAGRAEIEKRVTFHLSRNAAARKLYQNVGDIYKVSRFLGHSNVDQTQDYVDGFVDESRDEDFVASMS